MHGYVVLEDGKAANIAMQHTPTGGHTPTEGPMPKMLPVGVKVLLHLLNYSNMQQLCSRTSTTNARPANALSSPERFPHPSTEFYWVEPVPGVIQSVIRYMGAFRTSGFQCK